MPFVTLQILYLYLNPINQSPILENRQSPARPNLRQSTRRASLFTYASNTPHRTRAPSCTKRKFLLQNITSDFSFQTQTKYNKFPKILCFYSHGVISHNLKKFQNTNWILERKKGLRLSLLKYLKSPLWNTFWYVVISRFFLTFSSMATRKQIKN